MHKFKRLWDELKLFMGVHCDHIMRLLLNMSNVELQNVSTIARLIGFNLPSLPLVFIHLIQVSISVSDHNNLDAAASIPPRHIHLVWLLLLSFSCAVSSISINYVYWRAGVYILTLTMILTMKRVIGQAQLEQSHLCKFNSLITLYPTHSYTISFKTHFHCTTVAYSRKIKYLYIAQLLL